MTSPHNNNENLMRIFKHLENGLMESAGKEFAAHLKETVFRPIGRTCMACGPKDGEDPFVFSKKFSSEISRLKSTLPAPPCGMQQNERPLDKNLHGKDGRDSARAAIPPQAHHDSGKEERKRFLDTMNNKTKPTIFH